MSSLDRGVPGGWIGLEGPGQSGMTGVHSRGVSVGEAGSTAYCTASIFSKSVACCLGESTRFKPKIRLKRSVYSQKPQFGDGDHQILSNDRSDGRSFTPESSVVASQFRFFRVCGMPSGCDHSIWSLKIVFKINLLPKPPPGDGVHQKLSNV